MNAAEAPEGSDSEKSGRRPQSETGSRASLESQGLTFAAVGTDGGSGPEVAILGINYERGECGQSGRW